VEEIQEVCRSLDQDVQKRTTTLRELINDKYKDILEALDVAKEMRSLSQETTDSLDRLYNYLDSVKK